MPTLTAAHWRTAPIIARCGKFACQLLDNILFSIRLFVHDTTSVHIGGSFRRERRLSSLTQEGGNKDGVFPAQFVGEVARGEAADGLTCVVNRHDGTLICCVNLGRAVHGQFERVMAECCGNDTCTCQVGLETLGKTKGGKYGRLHIPESNP